MSLMWSRYTNYAKFEGAKCIFHALNFCVVSVDVHIDPEPYKELTAEELSSLPSELIDILVFHKLLIKNADVDQNELNDILERNKKIDMSNLILLISNDCNMDCSYCQIERNISGSKKKMSSEIVIATLQLFEKLCNRESSLTVNFTGGEPLINFSVIQEAVRFIRASDRLNNARLVIFTNGTLLDQTISEFLHENEFLVIVSLDGLESAHNLNRVFIDGSATYRQVLNGYLTAKNAGCNCAISSVANFNDSDFVDFLSWVIDLKPLSLGINYPHHILGINNEFDFNVYTRQILMAHSILESNGISLENYERFARTFKRKIVRRRECQACGRGITIDSNGNVGTCKSLLVSHKISYPLIGFDISKADEFEKWADRTPLVHENCLDCPAISICGGGCAYDAYCLFEGNALKMDRRMCNHITSIFFDLLEQQICKVPTPIGSFYLFEPNKNNEGQSVFESVGH